MSSGSRPNHWTERIEACAFAYRGYNVTNLGKSPELLAHPAYGPVVKESLEEASAICAAATGRAVDLVRRVRERAPTTLVSFAEDTATVVGMELAQLRLLERFFGVRINQARLSFGYSIGELSALVAGGVYPLDQLLAVPLRLADDCAALAEDVAMGIVFTRQRPLDLDLIRRLCVEISSQGKGLIGPSAWLSPNTVLVLGQGGTLDRFRKALSGERFNGALVRRNPHHWPPLHTPLTWQRNIPNRAAMGLFQATGGDRLPKPPILSLVTGDAGYTDYNSRDILIRWVDHPQLLWDVVYHTLAGGVEIVVHVGPEPNVVPATFERLAANISAQLGEKLLHGFGRRVISTIARSWLTQAISSKSALLRAPFLEHVVLEDWLLAQPVS